tara:strand:- start:655 stop:1119 length:465 start_codon:yes stop_codon:yes gene_type:complete
MFYKLDLPKLQLPEKWYTDNVQLESKKVEGYISYFVTKEVDEGIRSLFPKDFFPDNTHIIAQIIDARLNGHIHTDKRKYAINYVLNKGGLNAHTSVYSGDQVLEDTYTQQDDEWYLLNTFKHHAIQNVEDKRIALSISFYEFGDKQWEYLNDKM